MPGDRQAAPRDTESVPSGARRAVQPIFEAGPRSWQNS
jgi:hypothetical protein